MSKVSQQVGFPRLATLFFLHWMPLAMWLVPLTLVLQAHGLERIQPLAFATTAIGAVVSPLFFGALADRKLGPTAVLRWLCVASGATLAAACVAIDRGWNQWAVLGMIQVFAICITPTVSLSTTIAMAHLREPRRQFGPVRAMGTIGWMVGCWIVSAMGADASTLAGFAGAAVLLVLAGYTLFLPRVPPPPSARRLTIRERLGLDALSLFREGDHRRVFLTAALVMIPLAAFYPYTPPHLQAIGFERPSAWMSLGQTTEIIAMFALGALLSRWRLKWILGIGLACGVARFAACAMNKPAWLLIGIGLHGATYTLFFTTAQIYVSERVDPTWRARAQALLTFMVSGLGHLLGYLGCGWWFAACTQEGQTRWTVFWIVLAAGVGAVMIYFLSTYRGRTTTASSTIRSLTL